MHNRHDFGPYQHPHVPTPSFSKKNQSMIASDAMNAENGSTECVPFSQKVELMDLKIHSSKFYDEMEPLFVNTVLEQGDVFFFNRRLCHRGGENNTDKRRNSCITQSVWLWGIGQITFFSVRSKHKALRLLIRPILTSPESMHKYSNFF